MQIPKAILYGLLFFGFTACQPEKKEIKSAQPAPNITEAAFVEIPANRLTAPVIKTIDPKKLKIIPAGQPDITRWKNNQTPAGVPRLLTIEEPADAVPGRGSFPLPVKVPATGKIQKVPPPEMHAVKDMYIKSPNPAGFSMFGKQHGLKHGIITDILEDKWGNLWFSSAGGVTKYDGKFFTHFTDNTGLSHINVRCLLQDRAGNIWMGTLGNGVTKYDGRVFTHFTVTEGLSDNDVLTIEEDRFGQLWFGTLGGGISKYDGSFFTHYGAQHGLAGNNVQAILEDREGNVWLGTDTGLSRFDGNAFQTYSFRDELPSLDLYTITQDRFGNIWMGTIGAGVLKYDGKGFSHYSTATGLISNEINNILVTKSGDIWFGTAAGISRFDGQYVQQYTENEGLSSSNIYTLLEDSSGNIWAGTGGNGICKYSQPGFLHISDQEGLPKNYVFSIGADRSGNLWLGTWQGGVSKFDGKNFYQFTTRQGLPHNDVRCILADRNGQLWFATHKGVARYDQKSFVHFTEEDGLINNDVIDIHEDSSGHLWFATEGGVSRYNGLAFENYSSRQGLADNNVRCITGDQSGNIYFGTTGGINRYNGTGFSTLRSSKGDSAFSTYIIHEDKKGMLWVGTSGNGLLRFDGRKLVNLTEKEGLSNNNVSSLLEDSRGNLWFGTRYGISKMSPGNAGLLSARVAEGQIRETDVFFTNYSYEDGFTGLGCNYNSMLESGDGKIWIGTNTDLTVMSPEKNSHAGTPSHTCITAIKLFNETIDWALLLAHKDSTVQLKNGIEVAGFRLTGLSPWTNLPENLSLAYINNFISFDFIGITTDQPRNVKYQYRLEGIDKSWSILTTQTGAAYGNLPHGHYTFNVRSMNRSGQWGNESSFSFSIRPPWWKTWWFRAIAAAAILAAIAGAALLIYHYQLRKQTAAMEKKLALQYERERISSDLHDEIGSTLSSINIYAGLAKNQPHNTFYFDSINQNVTEVVSKLDDLVWSIKPAQDRLSSMMERINAYAVPVTRARSVDFSIHCEAEAGELLINNEILYNLYLVIKELINNAVKHSGCSRITVHMERQQQYLEITVADNGDGYDTAKIRTGRNGLANISKRVETLKGEYKTTSAKNTGTRVWIRIPA